MPFSGKDQFPAYQYVFSRHRTMDSNKITAENSAADNNASPPTLSFNWTPPTPELLHGAGPLPAPYWNP